MTAAIVEAIARRDRVVVFVALAAVVVASFAFMQSAGDALMRFDAAEALSLPYLALLFIMWWTMMLAMMLPSAAPAILTFAAMSRRTAGDDAQSRTLLFSAGYAAVWTGFSLAATGLHAALAEVVPMTPMMALTGRALGGILLVAAGIYQLTPFKASCLSRCQSPLMFFARNWRKGSAGAFGMGWHHGLYCLGCCAVLMAVLFYGGVMEPLWIGGLALYVMVEKLLPPRWPLSRLSGLFLVIWGLAVLFEI